MVEGYRIGVAADRDALTFASRLRAADLEEISAAAGHSPERALTRSLAFSTHAWSAYDLDGRPLAIWGVGPLALTAGKGCPWLLATDAFDALPRRLVARMSRRLLADVLALYPRLQNHVDARHARAVRWLRWLGFTLEPPVVWGVEQRLFHRFSFDQEKGPA